MKMLILSSNNGGGHNSVARSLLEEARNRNIDCTMIDAMLFLSTKRSEEMEKIHIGAALHAPSLFNIGNRMAIGLERKIRHKSRAQTRAAEHLKQFVLYNQFDIIIATQVFSAVLLTEMKARIASKLMTCFVVTDYCYIPFTAMTNLDAYFLPQKDLIPVYSRNERGRFYLPSGIPVLQQFVTEKSKTDARMELEIDPTKDMVLILSGSMGYGDIKTICRELLKTFAGTASVYVLCGRNKRLYRELADFPDTSQSLHPIEFTDSVGTYIDAADVVLTKPGGLSATEVAVKRKPLVFTKPIPGWEEENVRFFTARGMAFAGRTPSELVELTLKLISESSIRIQMKERQTQYINRFAARDILCFIEGYVASGEEPSSQKASNKALTPQNPS